MENKPNKGFYKAHTQPGEDVNPPDPLPKKIGPYKVEALLDQGGTSVLYLATKNGSSEFFAIKTLSQKYLSDEHMVARFHREAESLSITSHPGVVQLFDHGNWEGGLYIAMEYIQGHSLRTSLNTDPPSYSKAIQLIRDITEALIELHSCGVVHRDMKPENILLTTEGKVKVIDFGIAQLTRTPLTDSDRFIGTPFYMAPEQVADPNKASYPSDIYSLGIIAYELVIKRPCRGKVHLSLVPPQLATILQKTLQQNPNKRYQSAKKLLVDLTAYLQSEEYKKEKESEEEKEQLKNDLVQTVKTFIPQTKPNWPGIQIGLATQDTQEITGIYFDFFPLSNERYGIILSEPSSQGVKGALYSASIRGMIRSLIHILNEPIEFVTTLNTLLVDDPIHQIFTLNYLILDPKNNLFQLISCGYGKLWYTPAKSSVPQIISAENIALGIDPSAQFSQISQNWNIGDKILLHTFALLYGEGMLGEQALQKTLSETLYHHPQRQAEAIYQQVLPEIFSIEEQRNITLIALNRTEHL